MKALIITIGDEIVIGQITDTNSQFIASTLEAIGVHIHSIWSITDNKNEIENSILRALKEADIVITTGGLGPTKDDITKDVFCSIFNCGLKKDEESYKNVQEITKRRNVEFNVLNQQQAYIPEAATAILNRYGTAPGMWFEKEGKVVIALPGVPFEMKALMEETIVDKIKSKFTLQNNFHKVALTYGVPESILAVKIADWEDSLPTYIKLAYLPSEMGVRLRLSSYGAEKSVEKEIDDKFKELETIMGDAFVGYGDKDFLDKSAIELLLASNSTVATAESCTGGKLSSRFVANEGASAYFLGSVVSYSNDVKQNVLGVSKESLEKYGAVSKEVAMEMAKGVRELCGSDYAISTTGIAGPGGGSDQKPVGTVCVGFASKDEVTAQELHFGKKRDVNIDRFASAAMDLLRRSLIKK